MGVVTPRFVLESTLGSEAYMDFLPLTKSMSRQFYHEDVPILMVIHGEAGELMHTSRHKSLVKIIPKIKSSMDNIRGNKVALYTKGLTIKMYADETFYETQINTECFQVRVNGGEKVQKVIQRTTSHQVINDFNVVQYDLSNKNKFVLITPYDNKRITLEKEAEIIRLSDAEYSSDNYYYFTLDSLIDKLRLCCFNNIIVTDMTRHINYVKNIHEKAK